MKVAIYTRVSTDMQALEKCSLSVQAEKLQAYCQARDWNVVKIYTDPGYSGSNMERPALKAMIDDILAGYIDMVLVYKLDRLSRSQRDTLYMIEDIFLKNGADFVSMTENFDTSTPLGRAMIGILSVFAQLEREQIKERMAMGNVARAAKGLWRGGSGIPIGYDYKDGKIVTNEYERLQVETIYKMFLDGANYSTIMRHLQSKGYTHKYGPWKTIVTVKCVLANPVYIGKVKYAGEYYDGQHEKIIDEDTFYKVQKRIDEVTRGLTDHWKSPFVATKLLTGMIWCGDCGARYCGHSIVTKRPDGTRRSNHYYQCYTRNSHKTMRRAAKCNNKNRREEETDKIIISEIKKLALDPKRIDELVSAQRQTVNYGEQTAHIKSRIDDIDKQAARLMDLYAIDGISLESVSAKITKLTDEKKALEEELESLIPAAPALLPSTAKEIVAGMKDILDTGTLEERRKIVDALISRIVFQVNGDIDIYWKFI